MAEEQGGTRERSASAYSQVGPKSGEESKDPQLVLAATEVGFLPKQGGLPAVADGMQVEHRYRRQGQQLEQVVSVGRKKRSTQAVS